MCIKSADLNALLQTKKKEKRGGGGKTARVQSKKLHISYILTSTLRWLWIHTQVKNHFRKRNQYLLAAFPEAHRPSS